MRAVQFRRKDGSLYAVTRNRNEFMVMYRAVVQLERYGLYGLPYGPGKEKIPVFTFPMTAGLNPFWVKFYGLSIKLERPSKKEANSSIANLRGPIQARIKSSDRVGRTIPAETSKRRSSRGLFKYDGVPKGNVSTDEVSKGNWRYMNGFVSEQPFHNVTRLLISKTSVKTPGFFKMKKHERPWNPYSSVKVSARELKGFMVRAPGNGSLEGYFRGEAGNQIDWYLYSFGLINSPSTTGVSNIALNKALDRAKSQSVNLAQVFAERKQTVNLLYSSVCRLLVLAIAIKKGDFKRAETLTREFKTKKSKTSAILNEDGTAFVRLRRTRVVSKPNQNGLSKDDFANAWLEFQYGWRPLLSDIYGSCELIANTYYKRKPVQVSATSRQVNTRKIFTSNYVLATDNIWADQGQVNDELKGHVVLQFQEADDFSRAMSQTGITNPLNLAWELLPYSFVLDWFVPVGAYLNRLDSLVGLNFVKGSSSVSAKTSFAGKWVQTTKGKTSGFITGNEVNIFVARKNRSVFTSLPFPPRPTFQPHMGVERVLSAISLLNQVFTKGKTSLR